MEVSAHRCKENGEETKFLQLLARRGEREGKTVDHSIYGEQGIYTLQSNRQALSLLAKKASIDGIVHTDYIYT